MADLGVAPEEEPELARNVFTMIRDSLLRIESTALPRIEDKLDRKADMQDLVKLEARVLVDEKWQN